jgi:beta-glucosidase
VKETDGGKLREVTRVKFGVLRSLVAVTTIGLFAVTLPACAQSATPAVKEVPVTGPWMNKSLSPDERADLVLKQLTLSEKIDLLHGEGMPGWPRSMPRMNEGDGGAGFVLGIPRLGIPKIEMSDAAYGVRMSAQNGRYSTALPANVAAAASWDPESACAYGALIGNELRAQGYNMTLGGGVNLTREPRNGRTFEYQGEDPLLAGTLVGNRIKCEQAQHVIGDIKHYVMNDQENGRDVVNVIISKRAMRESDMLAFQIGIAVGNPAAVMCSYNAINGDYACQNKYTLTDVLKKDWHFKGFVLSDWGGTHSTIQASAAGLDNEQPLDDFFGSKLKQAVEAGKVPMSEIDDHAHRILRSEFEAGLVDYPEQKSVIDVEGHLAIAQHIAEQSIVLLKNSAALLPLDAAKIRSIAVIGPHADTGMISGGGSAQVDPMGEPAHPWQSHVWFPTSPLKAIRAASPSAKVEFASGADPAVAAALAKQSDVAIVFAYQWMSEGTDLENLSLPENQDALIEQVAAANPHTIVVLETGTAVVMPWIASVGGVLEAWYAGSKGADAVANVLFGKVNPGAKLPLTFPLSVADLPHPTLMKPPAEVGGAGQEVKPEDAKPIFSITYDEGVKVGYKWYDAENKPVLFPFGFGLSYTTYQYSDLKVTAGKEPTVQFRVKNTGARAGAEIAEVYVGLPAAAQEPPKRLAGWSKVMLQPGESREISLAINPRELSIYEEATDSWKQLPGGYTFRVGGSSKDLPLQKQIDLP